MFNTKVIGYSLINAIALLALTWFLQNQPYLYKDEELVISLNKFVKNILINWDSKPPSEEYLFINTAYDNQLVDKYDDSGMIPLGNQTITDREKLARLLETIKTQKEYKYIICDIFFKSPSQADSLLEEAFDNLPRIVIAYHLDDDGLPEYPIFNNVQNGLVTIETLNDIFLKYHLYRADSLRSLPLVVYESLKDIHFQPGGFTNRLGDVRVLDYFIPEYRIRNYDLLIAKLYPLVNLGDLLILNEEDINELVRNRLIIIGDFTENDMIETPIGEISGPLILTNILLALERGDIIITKGFMIFILISFFLISLLVFYPDDIVENIINRLKIKVRVKNFLIGISYLFFLGIISTFSYFFFHIYVNIFILALYLFLLDITRKKILS